jgi:hypothetical protein
MTHFPFFGRRAVASIATLLVALGCGDTARKPAIDESVANRLVGTWDLMLVLERPLSLQTDKKSLPSDLPGTMAFLEVGKEAPSFEGMSAPTHLGTYRVDMGSLGFPPREGESVPSLAARVVGLPHHGGPMGMRDSVYIVFNPETPRFSVLLSGTFDANAGSGVWSAESFLGGGGTFVMRRR